jgi:Domain of unknown function (DUF4129)
MSADALSLTRRQWSVQLLLLIAECALAWLLANVLFIAFSDPQRDVQPGIVLLMLVASTIIPRLLHDTGIWGTEYSVVVGLAIGVTTLLAVKQVSFPGYALQDASWTRQAGRSLISRSSTAEVSVWLVVLLAGAIWWRGRFREAPGVSAALFLLSVGAVLALVGSAGQAIVREDGNDREPAFAVLVFFAATLMAIAIARQSVLDVEVPSRWLGSVVIPVVLIAVAAISVAALASSDFLSSLAYYFRPVAVVLGYIFDAAVILISIILIIVLIPLIWVLSQIHINPELLETQTDRVPGELTSNPSDVWSLPDPIRYVVATLVVLGLFYGLTRFAFRLSLRETRSAAEATSLMTPGEILASVLGWIRWSRRRPPRSGIDPLTSMRGDPRWRHTIAVREIYADYLRWTRDRLIPRGASQTPREHEQIVLRQLGRDISPNALHRLVRVYTVARYGACPATEAEAHEAASAWKSARQPVNPSTE